MTQQVQYEDNDSTPPTRKSTLYCWECDHASPLDGEWILEHRENDVALVCPICETTITERPERDGPPPSPRARDQSGQSLATAWARVVSATVRLWRVSVTASKNRYRSI